MHKKQCRNGAEMKKKSGRAAVLAASLLFCMIALAYAYWNGGTIQDTARVSVVLDSPSSERWEVLRQGMESFAKEKDVEIKYITLTGRESVTEQMELLHREVQNGAEGIILNLQNREQLVKKMNDSMNQVKLVMVDSQLPLSFESGYVAADNTAMGRELADAALADGKEGESFGVITGNGNMESSRQRLAGVEERLGSRLIFTVSQAAGIPADLWPQVDRLLCLDVPSAEEALERAEKAGKPLYTIGRSEKLVYYLDKGIVDTMVVADEFVMGYAALEKLYGKLRYAVEMKDGTIPYITVNRDNLYSEEHERIMFPSVQ